MQEGLRLFAEMCRIVVTDDLLTRGLPERIALMGIGEQFETGLREGSRVVCHDQKVCRATDGLRKLRG